jgi:2-polyprenyl-6-methoxyphenol hydroxylase-like FAD-dependent oxidoreductase
MTALCNAPSASRAGTAEGVRQTDIAIAGGGLAGSAAAAMLARKGFGVLLVDPHAVYPPDLRCEKLDARQVDIFQRSGLADLVLPAGTPYRELWVARFGRVIEKRPEMQYGILYDTLVNRMRATIPAEATFINDKVTAIANSRDRQTITLSTGGKVCARLVVVATGLNSGLRNALGIVREDVSKCHCITLAFDMKPIGRSRFGFPALTYHGERTTDRIAYITLFPIGHTMRANLMVYRKVDDPWLREMRERPDLAMSSIMPRLANIIGRAEVVGPVKIRPADLCVLRGYLQPGIVLVGDAFATSCPAAGTGTDKVFTDIERLCNIHVPRWMQTDGMSVEKIAAFYADPVKVACDRRSFDRAFKLRSVSIDEGLSWRARRWTRFLGRLAIGSSRELLARMTVRP